MKNSSSTSQSIAGWASFAAAATQDSNATPIYSSDAFRVNSEGESHELEAVTRTAWQRKNDDAFNADEMIAIVRGVQDMYRPPVVNPTTQALPPSPSTPLPHQQGYGGALGTLDVLPAELRSMVLEHVFPEGATTASMTVFCDLVTDRIDVVRMRSDDYNFSPNTRSTLAAFSSSHPFAIHGPFAQEVTVAFWKNGKIVLNIQGQSMRDSFDEPFHPSPTFLQHAASKMSNLVIKLWLRHPDDSLGLMFMRMRCRGWYTSCAQVTEIKAFVPSEAGGRSPGLVTDFSQWIYGKLVGKHVNQDGEARMKWCETFLRAAGVGNEGVVIPAEAIKVLSLKLTSYNRHYTAGTAVTVP